MKHNRFPHHFHLLCVKLPRVFRDLTSPSTVKMESAFWGSKCLIRRLLRWFSTRSWTWAGSTPTWLHYTLKKGHQQSKLKNSFRMQLYWEEQCDRYPSGWATQPADLQSEPQQSNFQREAGWRALESPLLGNTCNSSMVVNHYGVFMKAFITVTWEYRCLRFEGVEDGRLHDVIPTGEFLEASFLDIPIIFSFTIAILLQRHIFLKLLFCLGNKQQYSGSHLHTVRSMLWDTVRSILWDGRRRIYRYHKMCHSILSRLPNNHLS